MSTQSSPFARCLFLALNCACCVRLSGAHGASVFRITVDLQEAASSVRSLSHYQIFMAIQVCKEFSIIN